MYALVITINYCYWEHDCKYHCARQVEKEALKSHSQKQEKPFTSGPTMASQNKANPSLVVLSAKTSSKSSPSPASKIQFNTPWVNLSSKLASNDKLTSDECKKRLENNLCLYCSVEDYKLNSCSKKQTMVFPKGCGALAAASEKPLEK